MISPSSTRVFLVILAQGHCTYPSIMRDTGLRSAGSVGYHLRLLRDAGLVTWEPGLQGTIRPLVAVR